MVDFDNLDESAHVFDGHDVGYCCLGTTVARDGKVSYKLLTQPPVPHSIPSHVPHLIGYCFLSTTVARMAR